MITFGSLSAQLYAADTIQFNTALFDLEDKKTLILSNSHVQAILCLVFIPSKYK